MALTLLLRFLANGDLAIAAATTILAITAVDAAGILDRRPRTARAAAFTLLLTGALGALGAPPVPLVLAVPLAFAFGFHALYGFYHRRKGVRRASAIALGVAAAIAIVHEIPYAVGPDRGLGTYSPTLTILGDSLSAGGYGESRTWPRILAEDEHLDVRDLSRDGQTVVKALGEYEEILGDPPSTNRDRVLIELGGNDVLGESTLADYTASLDRLLALCRGDPQSPRTVLMLEIPAVPGRWGFAAAQRRLAGRHGVVLVPKRVLANVVFAPGSTSDDVLHLTQRGHDRFAAAIRPWLGIPR